MAGTGSGGPSGLESRFCAAAAPLFFPKPFIAAVAVVPCTRDAASAGEGERDADESRPAMDVSRRREGTFVSDVAPDGMACNTRDQGVRVAQRTKCLTPLSLVGSD
jgi:hypothetical protein